MTQYAAIVTKNELSDVREGKSSETVSDVFLSRTGESRKKFETRVAAKVAAMTEQAKTWTVNFEFEVYEVTE